MSDKPSTNTVESDTDAQLRQAKEAFERCQSAAEHNHLTALDDVRFARLLEQWPADIKAKREREKRPCHTISKMNAFIRQVVNDSRQNKPSIKVHPADSGADVETAEVINGLIRNIEYTSNADVAYDTAVENAVSGGFGFFRIGMDYAYDDTFDMDLKIERINNSFAVYGDPNSTAADSSDWDVAFVVDAMPKSQFEAKYGGKKNVSDDPVLVDFAADAWSGLAEPWMTEETVLLVEWWTREEVEKEIVQLSDGSVYAVEDLENDEDLMAVSIMIESGQLQVVQKRKTKSWKVRQRIMSGVDILEDNEWPGKYIPIVPVYGDEFDIEGKRYFRSLIHPAKDAQRMFNYWRTASTELVALAPRVPWIGRKGTFDSDAERWNTANTESHSYLEYDGDAPQRMPLDSGPAAGALSEALNASDDMKAIIGLYDASLGARSNETSGKAIMARQREGDVATFHFIDNLTRAIRHAGRILIDLIPKIYNTQRIVRVLGEDGSEEAKPINQQYQARDENGQPMQDEQGQAIMAMHDLTAGKYDLTVTAGPSFTTRREEAATQMTELIRAFPQAAPIIADLLAKNLDWPGADEIAKRFEKMNPTKQQVPPEVQEQIQNGMQKIAELTQDNQELKQKLMDDMRKAATEQAKADADKAKTGLEYDKMDFERQKMGHEWRMMLAQNDMKEEEGEDGETSVVSKTDEFNRTLVEALNQIVESNARRDEVLVSQIEKIATMPRKAELMTGPNGEKMAVSYPMTEQ